MFNLDEKNWYEADYAAPLLAVPRLPYDVLFAIGGWHNHAPTTIIETYDNRAKRWISANKYADRNGPRVHHGATVIDQRIFCIGGFNYDQPHNSCRVFDAVTKSWHEVC